MPQVKIVMLTVSSSDEYLFEAIKSGASGYLLKSQSAELFLELISKVESGAVLPPEMAAKVLGEFARQANRLERVTDEPAHELTDRQTQILTLVAQGMPYTKIGDLLHISEPTVRYHMGQILERLHLQNRAQVIAYASRHGMIR
jgi:two-component system NarL family response regulator